MTRWDLLTCPFNPDYCCHYCILFVLYPPLPLALAFEVCLAVLMLLVAAPVDLVLGLTLIVATTRALASHWLTSISLWGVSGRINANCSCPCRSRIRVVANCSYLDTLRALWPPLAFEVCLAGLMLIVAAPVGLVLGLTLGSYPSNSC